MFPTSNLHFYNVKKINHIDETQTPEIHLKQWQDYQIFQKKQRHWNLPIYYLILGIAISVYLYEILKITDTWKMITAFAMTYGWFIISYFWLGKKQIKKQDAKIDGIINDLKNLENQFQ